MKKETTTYDVTSYTIGGTNNIHVMGGMLVSNAANGAVTNLGVALSWTTPVVPLVVGNNEIYVIGTNYLNRVASDSVIITRGGIGTGKPYVDITTPDRTVSYGTLSIAVEGTFILNKEPKKKKIIGADNADWIIDGKLQ